MIKIDISQLNHILDHTPADQNIMLVGSHGIGKSEILAAYFKDKGMKVIPLFLGQMSDPGDIIGLPFRNDRTEGLSSCLRIGSLLTENPLCCSLMNLTGQGRKYFRPSWI